MGCGVFWRDLVDDRKQPGAAAIRNSASSATDELVPIAEDVILQEDDRRTRTQ